MIEPPARPEAEDALIGALLFDPERIADVVDWFQPAAFTSQQNRTLYQAMVALRAKSYPVDYVTLTDLLKSRGKLDLAGGYDGIAQLFTATNTNAAAYAELVHEAALQREAIHAGQRIVETAYNGAVDVESLIGDLRSETAPYLPRSSAGASLAETMDAHRDRVLDRWEGRLQDIVLPTGIGSLDRIMLGGLRPGDLCYIGARPGMGKTAGALQIASALARAGGRGLFVELEMSREAILNRMIAADAQIPFAVAYQAVGDLGQRERWLDASDRVAALAIDIDSSLRTTQKIAAACRRENYAAVFVDHLDYLADPDLQSLPTEVRTAETSKRLRRLAQDTGVAVIALAQLNRSVEHTPPFRPALTSFRYSGGIEQDADYAFLLYRRKYYVDRGLLESEPEDYLHGSVQRAELIVAKNRNGEVPAITLGWRPESMSFSEENIA